MINVVVAIIYASSLIMDTENDEEVRNNIVRFYYFSQIVDLISDSISNYGLFEHPALKLPIVQGDLLCNKTFLNMINIFYDILTFQFVLAELM